MDHSENREVNPESAIDQRGGSQILPIFQGGHSDFAKQKQLNSSNKANP